MAARVFIASLLLLVLLQWSPVDGQCGGNFTEPTGNFSSPNYPDEYPNNILCDYFIDVEPGNGIELTFVDFELEDCPWDHVTVHVSTGVETYCGALGSVGPILEPSSSLRITFETDDSNTFSIKIVSMLDQIDYTFKYNPAAFSSEIKSPGSSSSPKQQEKKDRAHPPYYVPEIRGFSAEYRSIPAGCGDDLEHGGACYRFADEPRTALEASRECEGVGASLASIHSDEENAFIGANAPSSPLWIGLRKQGSDWGWTDGSPYDYENFNPNFLSGDEFAYMWMDRWGNDECRRGRAFVCRLRSEDGEDCPDSWIHVGEDCYLVVDSSREFQAAVEFCREAMPRSALFTVAEGVNYDDVVALVFNGQGGKEVAEFWIGLKRDDALAWNWIDNSTSSVENWSAGFPVDDPEKDCAYAFPNTWDDYPNNHLFPFVCKRTLQIRD
ncbi:unnamed protein product [Darwinula stevensoni]|uniref:Uncharacterized protein n=1 Tax=Darwinula stevensoni TaxID=69355 RepID=A0A7R9FNY0_9CRUS|nr:unnamed protein product [Darwinula stevensoni]CAG0896972.1 unnamed protein product [Darwinula stevensoni]